MKSASLPLMLVVALWACNANTSKDTAVTVRDSVGVVPDSAAKFEEVYTPSPGDTALLGFYDGVLPCKDCQGIKHTLLLKDSGRFRLEEFTLGRSTFPKKTEGRWNRQGDSLRLTANRELLVTYYIKNDTLRLGYQEGNPIADSISKNYWIARQPAAASNAAWQKRGQAGVDFYAIGNEPFWNLEIDREGSIAFRIADLPKPLLFNYRPPRETKDSSYYLVDSGSARLEVTVFNEFCSDGMSDNLYEHRVHVRYKGETFKGCGVYLKRRKK